jgi:hypothetical protein
MDLSGWGLRGYFGGRFRLAEQDASSMGFSRPKSSWKTRPTHGYGAVVTSGGLGAVPPR